MARQTFTGKNQPTGPARDFGRVGLEVVHPTDIQAPLRDTRPILQAIDEFKRTQIQPRLDEAVRKERDNAFQFGARDAALGRADEEQMKANRYYAEGVQHNRVSTAGYEFIAQAQVELDRALREDPNLDFDQWAQTQRQAFVGMTNDGEAPLGELAVKAQNNFLQQFEQNARSSFESRKAKLLYEQANTEFANALTAGLNLVPNGQLNQGHIDKLTQRHNVDGIIEPEVVENIVGTLLLQRLGTQQDLAAYEAAQAAGYLDKAEWSDKFQRQREATEAGLERDRQQAMRDDLRRSMQAAQELNGLVGSRQLTQAFLERGVQESRYTRDEAMRAWNAQLSGIRQDTERARRATEKDQQRQQALAMMGGSGGPGSRLRFQAALAASGIEESDVEDALNYQWGQTFVGMASGDPEVRQQSKQNMEALIEQAQTVGLFPKGLRKAFDEADIGRPEDFRMTANMYREMEADGMGDFLRNQMSGQSYAKIRYFQRLVEQGGLTEEEAIRRMNDSAVPMDEAERRAARAYDLLEPLSARIAKEGGGGHFRVAVEKNLTELTLANIMLGVPPEVAVRTAETQFGELYDMLEGMPFRKEWTAQRGEGGFDALKERWPDYRDGVLLPAVQEEFGEEVTDVRIAPQKGEPGRFMFMINGILPLRTKDNEVHTVGMDDILTHGLDAKMRWERDYREVRDEAIIRMIDAPMQ